MYRPPDEPFTPARRTATPGGSSAPHESTVILQEALQNFQLQNSQLGHALLQVNESLRELSQGQSHMIMMMGSAAIPAQATGPNGVELPPEDQRMEGWSPVHDTTEASFETSNPNETM